MRANVVNMQVDPHWDKQPGMTASQVYGTYSGPEGAGMLYVPSLDRAFVFTDRSLLLLRANTNYHGVGEWTEGTRCCTTQYMTADMFNINDSKRPLYPEEVRAQRAQAKQTEADNRVAKGVLATLDACPFCKRSMKGFEGVFQHLSSRMRAEKVDSQHPFDQIANWINNYNSREAYGGKKRRQGKGVFAAEEYRRVHPKVESKVDAVLPPPGGQGKELEKLRGKRKREHKEQSADFKGQKQQQGKRQKKI